MKTLVNNSGSIITSFSCVTIFIGKTCRPCIAVDCGGYLCKQRCRSQLGSAVWQGWKQPIAHQNFNQWYFHKWYCSNLLYKEWQRQEAKRGRAGVARWGDVRRMGKQDSWKIRFWGRGWWWALESRCASEWAPACGGLLLEQEKPHGDCGLWRNPFWSRRKLIRIKEQRKKMHTK